MSTSNQSNYYLGAFIVSIIGGIMLLVGEFAGWENNNYYLGVYTSGSVNLFSSELSGIIIGGVAAIMLYMGYLAYLSSKEPPSTDRLNLMYQLSIITLVIILIGGLIFVIEASENEYWWFGEGFYGGSVGSLLSLLLFRAAKQQ